MRRQRVAVFGSTGSIGRAALEVIDHHPDRLELVALAAGQSAETVVEQVQRYRPKYVAMTDLNACHQARAKVGQQQEILWGPAALLDIATSPTVDTVVMAMAGTIGLLPVIAAIEQGKRVCIATKEILVGFGNNVMRLARRHAAQVLPIDSELVAVHQCLADRPVSDVSRVLLTASGGPFWRTGPPPAATIKAVLRHPTWKMGRKITVDSATLMNKGLEVIETACLFGLKASQIETVIHPQSIVHSLVEFRDGSVMAQLSNPDMRLPIQYALLWPERRPSLTRPLDLRKVRCLEFWPTDPRRFPCLKLAYQALTTGGVMPCVLNAANQVAVESFLAGRIKFGRIPELIAAVMANFTAQRATAKPSIRRLLAAEQRATQLARNLIE